ncbi:MAG: FKBP-type peptidyl-prolyl cis-trans isomerase [Clostridia bacterium]|nr:FKBP-type peptidyl-prolyl cis-trans isomerase [Clostridia bacterium]
MKKKVLCLICAILFVVPLLVSCKSGLKYDYDDLGEYVTLPDYKSKVIEYEKDYIQATIDNQILTLATNLYKPKKGDNIYVDITYKTVKWLEKEDGTMMDQFGDEITELTKNDFLIENLGNGNYAQQIEDFFVDTAAFGTEYTKKITLNNAFPVEAYRDTEVYVTYKFSAMETRRGDVVKVSYTGYYLDENDEIKKDEDGNEETFDEGTMSAYLGSHTAIDDFETNLTGIKTGNQVEFFATFPEDYGSEDVAGKKVKFKATVSNVYEVPVYDDEFVKENFGYETRKELEEALIKDYVTQEIISYLVDGSTVIKYPDKEYKNFINEVNGLAYAWQQIYGYSYEVYLQIYEGKTLQEYIDYNLKFELVYYAYAQKEGLVPNDEQIATARNALIELYTSQNMSSDSTVTEEQARQKATQYVDDTLGDSGIYDEAIFKIVEDSFESVFQVKAIDATYTSVTTEKMPPMEDTAE